MHRPVAAILRADGMPGEQIDLAETAGDESTYRRTIVRSVHDKRYEAQKASFFVMK
jgi:hypothetical protein